MSLSHRERRVLMLLVPGLAVSAVLHFGFPDKGPKAAVASGDSTELALKRLTRLRQLSAMLPVREAAMKQMSADLDLREHGVIVAETAAQGQAALLEIARRVGQEEQLDVRAGEFGAPVIFGEYGLVYATVTFEGHVEQIVNFLADLSKIPELVVPQEEHIAATAAKDKTMAVRIVLAGVVAKKLVPEKKGLASF